MTGSRSGKRRARVVALVLAVVGVAAACSPTPDAPPPAVSLAIDPASVDLEAPPNGGGSIVVTVENIGNLTSGPLHSSVESATGVGTFGIPLMGCDNRDLVLAPGDACTMTVAYVNPTGSGSATAALRVVGDGGAVATIPLRGTGVPGGIEIYPEGWVGPPPDYGVLTDAVGRASPRPSLMVVNTSGATVSSVAVTLEDAAGIGTFNFEPGQCTGVVLLPGRGCAAIIVEYINKTGSGTGTASLVATSSVGEDVMEFIGVGAAA